MKQLNCGMKGLTTILLLGVLVAITVTAPLPAAFAQVGARIVSYSPGSTIPLPGPPGHGDWVTYDPANGYVYLAHCGSNVVIVSMATNTIVTNIENIPGPNGIAYDDHYIYVTSGGGNFTAVISKSDWKVATTFKTSGTTPDGIWVDKAAGKLYVASDDANQIEVYAPLGTNPHLINIIPLLPAKFVSGPDVGIIVPSKKMFYQPVDNLLLAISLDTGKIVNQLNTKLTIASNGATKNLVYDPQTNHLWEATTQKVMLVLDADSLKEITRIPASASEDQMDFDSALRLIYAFGGTGFDIYDADSFQHLGFLDTGSGNAHTGVVNQANHQVYLYEGNANLLAIFSPGDATTVTYIALAVGIIMALAALGIVTTRLARRKR